MMPTVTATTTAWDATIAATGDWDERYYRNRDGRRDDRDYDRRVRDHDRGDRDRDRDDYRYNHDRD